MFNISSFAKSLLLVTLLFVFVVSPSWRALAAQNGDIDFLSDEYLEEEEAPFQVNDPLESLNRIIFSFNDVTYIWVINPVTTGYSHVLPSDIRACIRCFFRNLEEPARFVNTVLQGRFRDSGKVVVRFLINSTLGVYGFADAATRVFEIEPVDATLGETMSIWGIGDGFYLVAPFYGPSTLRDLSGTVLDVFVFTPNYYGTTDLSVLTSIYTGMELNKLSFHLGEYEDLKSLTFDPYVSFRNIYYQHRKAVRKRNTTDR